MDCSSNLEKSIVGSLWWIVVGLMGMFEWVIPAQYPKRISNIALKHCYSELLSIL